MHSGAGAPAALVLSASPDAFLCVRWSSEVDLKATSPRRYEQRALHLSLREQLLFQLTGAH